MFKVQDWFVCSDLFSKKIAWDPHARMEGKHVGKLRTTAALQQILFSRSRAGANSIRKGTVEDLDLRFPNQSEIIVGEKI